MVDRKRPRGEVWMQLKDRKLMARLMLIQERSARSLARESGFGSHTYVQRLLRGEVTTCSAERAVAIAAVLQVPLDSLFVTKVSSGDGSTVHRERPFREGPQDSSATAGAHPTGRGPRRAAGSAEAVKTA